MENRTYEDIICIFCGKQRRVTHWTDDGIDFYGHGRGNPESGTIDAGCDCEFSKLLKNKATIKPMCLNCKSYKNGSCTNKEKLEKMTGMFDMGCNLKVKKPECHCECYELDTNIFKKCCK